MNYGFTANVCYFGGDISLTLTSSTKPGVYKVTGNVTNVSGFCMKGGKTGPWSTNLSGEVNTARKLSATLGNCPSSAGSLTGTLVTTPSGQWRFDKGVWFCAGAGFPNSSESGAWAASK